MINHVNNICIQHENINWSHAPKWANFYAVDHDGERYWFKNKPSLIYNEYGIIHWHDEDKCEQAPGYKLDDYYMYVFTRNTHIKLNRVYEDGNYILINDSKDNDAWFSLFKKVFNKDYDYVKESEFYYFDDAISHIWQNFIK